MDRPASAAPPPLAAARNGADVAINYLGDATGAHVPQAVAGNPGPWDAGHLRWRVMSPQRKRRTASSRPPARAFGRVDVFVSNAGICPFHAFLDMPVETFERTAARQLARSILHGAGRGQSDGAAMAAAAPSSRFFVHFRIGRRRVPDALHPDQGGRAFADAVRRHRPWPSRHSLQLEILPGTIRTEINRAGFIEIKRNWLTWKTGYRSAGWW